MFRQQAASVGPDRYASQDSLYLVHVKKEGVQKYLSYLAGKRGTRREERAWRTVARWMLDAIKPTS